MQSWDMEAEIGRPWEMVDKAHSLVCLVSSGPVRSPVSNSNKTQVHPPRGKIGVYPVLLCTYTQIDMYACVQTHTYVQNINVYQERNKKNILNEFFITSFS